MPTRRGQQLGFRHTEETKARISAAFKGKGPRGGFAIRVTCDGCGREMNAANLTRHKPLCQKYDGYTITRRKQNKRLTTTFGMSITEYETLVMSQDGRCAVCKDSTERKLFVDHDHTTGTVRGLLCTRCNTGLGMMRDNPHILYMAIVYLMKYREGVDTCIKQFIEESRDTL